MQAKAKTQASTRVKELTLVDHIKRHLAPAVVAAGLGWVLFNVLDREPPFTVIDVSVTPRTVNAGSDAQSAGPRMPHRGPPKARRGPIARCARYSPKSKPRAAQPRPFPMCCKT